MKDIPKNAHLQRCECFQSIEACLGPEVLGHEVELLKVSCLFCVPQ